MKFGKHEHTSSFETVLQRTREYIVRHFGMEEKYMRQTDYPGLDRQKAEHESFKQSIAELVEEYKKEGLSPAIVDTLRHTLVEWLKKHVTGLDQDFGTFYREKIKTE